MIASLKSERLKTPNEGSKPDFHVKWIRELVRSNALVLTDSGQLLDCRVHGSYPATAFEK